jgi:tetratricopeptide (TPR) repeat protein
MQTAPSGADEPSGGRAGSPPLHRRVAVALAALPILALFAGFVIGIRAVRGRAVPAVTTADAESSRRDTALRLVGVGLGYHRSGKPELAEAFYRAAAAVDPGLALAYYDLGCVALDRHDLEAAEGWFKEALRADPKDENAGNNLKWVLAQKQTGAATGPPGQTEAGAPTSKR